MNSHVMLNTTIGDERVIRTLLNLKQVIDETASSSNSNSTLSPHANDALEVQAARYQGRFVRPMIRFAIKTVEITPAATRVQPVRSR